MIVLTCAWTILCIILWGVFCKHMAWPSELMKLRVYVYYGHSLKSKKIVIKDRFVEHRVITSTDLEG